VDLTGQTSLYVLWKVIGEGDLLISCDTGVLHLAYGVGTPSLSLFGAGSEVKWAPKGKRHRSINKHFSCSPCTVFGVTPPCPIEVACLETISVEEVEEAAWKLLKEIRS
jgi:ADP-heptose:LPS heptosyltransferase